MDQSQSAATSNVGKSLLNISFDPFDDLKRNVFGVLELAGNKPDLTRDIEIYFRLRDEIPTNGITFRTNRTSGMIRPLRRSRPMRALSIDTAPAPSQGRHEAVADHPVAADKTFGFALSASLSRAFPCSAG